MSTFFCILSGRECDEGERTPEHVIPFSLGGGGQLVTRDASSKANSDLGTTIDAPLVAEFLIGFERWRLGLRSQGGNVPPIEFRGTVEINGVRREASYRIEPDGRTDLVVVPVVKGGIKDLHYSVQCSPDSLAEIQGNLEAKAKRHGLKLKVLESRKETIANPSIQTSLVLSRTNITRGLLKIALGASHVQYGYPWSRSEVADRFRAYLWASPDADIATYKIKGTTWPEFDPNLMSMLRVDDSTHVIWFGGPLPESVTVILFGKYAARFILADTPPPRTPAEAGTVYVVDSRTRTVERRTLAEHVARLHGPPASTEPAT